MMTAVLTSDFYEHHSNFQGTYVKIESFHLIMDTEKTNSNYDIIQGTDKVCKFSLFYLYILLSIVINFQNLSKVLLLSTP